DDLYYFLMHFVNTILNFKPQTFMQKTIITAALFSLLFAACDNNQQANNAAPSENATDHSAAKTVDEHNAQNSLDWMGTYEGILPCADCEGIKTTIILKEDGTYSSKETYLNRPVDPLL